MRKRGTREQGITQLNNYYLNGSLMYLVQQELQSFNNNIYLKTIKAKILVMAVHLKKMHELSFPK